MIIYHYPQSIMTTLSLSLVGLGDQATEVEKERGEGDGKEVERQGKDSGKGASETTGREDWRRRGTK